MKKLTIHDYDVIKDFLNQADYEGYNSNFVTMMMWNHEYHIEYEIHEHYLIMLHHYKNVYFWAMPFTTKEYYKEAIEYMREYSRLHHFDFLMDCAISPFVEEIKKIYGTTLLYERTPYNDDYVYDKNMLMTLSGKKMQKRRNHYNAFCREYPQYEYRDLDLTDDFNDVLNCLTKWESDKQEKSESLTSEIYGIMLLLSSQNLLDVKAGAIYIDGVMEAFIMASKLNHKTIQIHVEKANKNIRGLYPAILKELLEHHFKDDLYVNREEDMGLENLRKSKLSLHPIHMVEKYRIRENHTQVVNAREDEKNIIKDIWFQTFEDETLKSSEFYFNESYKNENTYLLKYHDMIISGCQIVPYTLSYDQCQEEVYFLLGVFTLKNFEGQGCMKKLLNEVFSKEQYKNKKIYLQAYHPEVYQSLGFRPSHYHQKIRPSIEFYKGFDEDMKSNDYSLLKQLYDAYTSNFDEYRIRDEHYFQWLIKRCDAFENEITIFKYNDIADGYAIYHKENDVLYVEEIIYKNIQALQRIIATLLKDNDQLIIETDLKAEIVGDKEEIVTMYSNYNYPIAKENKFINEVY